MMMIFVDFVLMGHGIQIFPILVLHVCVLKIALLLLITGEVNITQNKQQQKRELFETSLTLVYVKQRTLS